MRSFYPFVLSVLISLASVAISAQEQNPSLPVAESPTVDGKASSTSQTQAIPEEMPVTVRPNGNDSSKKTVDSDPIMGVPALPKTTTTIIGGRVSKVDGVRNKLGVKIFGGGGQWEMSFDERTHFFRDGRETTFASVKKGDRVYVDTMLDPDSHRILARNVRVVEKTQPSDAAGQVESFDEDTIRINDDLSAQSVRFHFDGSTQVQRNGKPASLSELQPGALIEVKFSPDQENRAVARMINILVVPGDNFTFNGRVMFLDLSSGVIAVENQTDKRTYDIAIDRQGPVSQDLSVGSEVTIAAVFDGRQYKANRIDIRSK